MSKLLFGRTQNAYQTPFDSSDPAAIAAGFVSTDVFNAILEAKQDAINNDRYPILCHYNGNANAGRYLEIFPARASNTAPHILPTASNIVAVVFACEAASTGTIQIYNLTTATVLYTVTFTAETTKVFTGLMIPAAALNRLAVRVNTGSLNKPYGIYWVNSST